MRVADGETNAAGGQKSQSEKERSRMLIRPSIYHRTIGGKDLVTAREGLYMSQTFFARMVSERMGRKKPYSQQFIQQLEAPGDHEISTDLANAIIDLVLRK